MRLSRVVVLGVALGAGAIAAVLAVNLTSSPPPPPPQVTEQETPVHSQVMVAAKDIPMKSVDAPFTSTVVRERNASGSCSATAAGAMILAGPVASAVNVSAFRWSPWMSVTRMTWGRGRPS